MPLLRAGGVRVHIETVEGQLVDMQAVSMPLLRAGGVRVRDCLRSRALSGSLSQCPCCGRGSAGNTESGLDRPGVTCLNALVAGGGSAGWTNDNEDPLFSFVSMPLLRAGGVRVKKAREVVGPMLAVSMPLLRAGGVRAATRRPAAPVLLLILSQCPCCGRGECGTSSTASPILPPEPSQCPCCGRGECGCSIPIVLGRVAISLNALVAGGGSAGRGIASGSRRFPAACLNALVAGGGSAGR